MLSHFKSYLFSSDIISPISHQDPRLSPESFIKRQLYLQRGYINIIDNLKYTVVGVLVAEL